MPRKPAQKAEPPKDQKLAIVDAAMRLAAERPWQALSLAEIADAAELGVVELYRLLSSKAAILREFSRRVDAAALAVATDPEERPRDRLFDILMRRFDALAPYKPALRRMVADTRRLRFDPIPMALCLPRSMGWMLEAAHISSTGIAGAVRVKVLCLAYLSVLRTYLDDESPDLTRTMAALDRALRRAEPFLRLDGGTQAKTQEAAWNSLTILS
ncbi:MAG TPA: helix-turn-helix domain-containing protein [Aliidongia sp.]|nr:helix-turn-helix domain-containing protein [Aliidongia sp.]